MNVIHLLIFILTVNMLIIASFITIKFVYHLLYQIKNVMEHNLERAIIEMVDLIRLMELLI